MFLQQLPTMVRVILLFLVGTGVGALINLAIYQLALFNPRKVSPWSSPGDDRPTRPWHYRIPVVGWSMMRHESEHHGRGFWIRPLLIELAWGVGLVWFYQWQVDGGLFAKQIHRLDQDQAAVVDIWTHTWFLFHTVLLALLTVATFIDFDEKTIPDWITIPGTIFGLLVMCLAPYARLPQIQRQNLNFELSPLTSTSPGDPTTWHMFEAGLWVALLILLIWCFGLLPKIITFRYGLLGSFKYFWASLVRPARKTRGRLSPKPRAMFTSTKVIFAMALVGTISIFICWKSGGRSWDAMFDSLLGLAMGGGIVWAVRIIAGYALGTEAMGFGDVTLMCMIGAFVGWQPALLVFVFAPFTSIFVTLVMLVITREQRLAFGPYLCLSAVIVLIGWHWIWNEWAADGVFLLGGPFLIAVIGGSLILMAVMLIAWSKIKSLLSPQH